MDMAIVRRRRLADAAIEHAGHRGDAWVDPSVS